MSEAYAVFSGRDIASWSRSCVYILWRGNQCEYVGVSSNGVMRPLDPKHHALGGDIQAIDELLCLFVPGRDAFELERVLIELLRPKRNGGVRKRLGVVEFFRGSRCWRCRRTFMAPELGAVWCPECRAAMVAERRAEEAPRACSSCGQTFKPDRKIQPRCGRCRHFPLRPARPQATEA